VRLDKITLRDYRGVEEMTVEFSDGVTVIEGPNEVGKSSLAEAIGLIRKMKATQANRTLAAIKPVHRDAGPEVVLELRTGPYRLSYRKRWLKTPVTELSVHAPEPAQYTGDEAHNKFLEILGQTVDIELWEALETVQGKSLSEPALGGVTALQRALGESAAVGDNQDGLMGLIEEEYRRYFTATGRPNSEFAETVKAADRSQAEFDRWRQESAELDDLVERHRESGVALERLGIELAEASSDLESKLAEAKAVEQLRVGAETAARARIDAERLAPEAAERAESRSKLAAEAARRETAVDAAKAKLAKANEALTRANTAVEERTAEAEEATVAHGQAEAKVQAARAEAERRRRIEERGRTARRLEEARQLAARVDDARSSAEGMTGPDADTVKQLEALAAELAQAEATERAAAARVKVTRLGKTPVAVDGAWLETQGTVETPATAPVLVTAAGVVEVEIHPGTPPNQVGELRADLAVALRQAGADTLAQAHVAAERRRETTAIRREAEAELKGLLGTDTIEKLEQKLARIEAELESTEADPTPTDLPAAEATLQQTQTALATAQRALTDARAEAATAAREQTRAEAESAAAAQERDRVTKDLATSRSKTPDDALNAAVTATRQTATEAGAGAEQAAAALAQSTPDRVTSDLAAAETHLATTRAARDTAANQVRELRAVIGDRSARGVYDQLARAEAALDEAIRQRDRRTRAAEAARLLRDTMVRHRDDTQARYRAPFQERVTLLARALFGPDAAVEVAQDLSITARTWQGRTVPFADLSAGAREQLALLERLACAALVDVDDGAPILIDDSPSFADPARLAALGPVLAESAQRTQVILLTCDANRFAGLPGATRVHLAPTPAKGEKPAKRARRHRPSKRASAESKST
jgi:hypothetical protein